MKTAHVILWCLQNASSWHNIVMVCGRIGVEDLEMHDFCNQNSVNSVQSC